MSISLAQVIAIVDWECKAVGGQLNFAKKHGLSPQYVNDVIRQRREPGKKILAALMLKKIITYECE